MQWLGVGYGRHRTWAWLLSSGLTSCGTLAKMTEAPSPFSHWLDGVIVLTTHCCEDYLTELLLFLNPFVRMVVLMGSGLCNPKINKLGEKVT